MRMIFAMAAALVLAACNPMAQMSDADTQIDQFHGHYSSGDYDAIYEMADSQFHQAVNPKDWADVMAVVSTNLGAVEDSSQTGFNINTDNGVTTTTITRETTFELDEGTETFIFVGSGEDMKLLNWEVVSEALLEPARGEASGKPEAETAKPEAEPVS